MIGDQNADVACAEVADDALDIEHGDRVDTGERLVEKHELWLCGKRARDFHTPPLAARQALTETVADMPDVQLVEQRLQHRLALFRVELRPCFEDCVDVVAHAQLAKYRRLLRQIAEAEACAPMHG